MESDLDPFELIVEGSIASTSPVQPMQSAESPKLRRRRLIVIEPLMQWHAALAVGAVVATGLLMMSVARYFLAGRDLPDLSGEWITRLTLLWNGLLIGFVTVAVVGFALILTHKVAGPARVLERKIE